MTQDVIAELSRESGEISDFHRALLDHVMGLVRMSRTTMSKSYSDWDNQQSVYKGERMADKEDIEQAKRDKPVKMVVPSTFAQVMTFTSFLFLLYTQNRSFYELLPTGEEDYGTKYRDSEMLLERDVRANQWNALLFQHLLDTSRFGTGVLECCWTRKLTRIYVPQEPTVLTLGAMSAEVGQESEWKEFVKYEGNLVRAVSPYRWLPDTRYPLVDFQKGEFCASEEEYSKTLLKDLEEAGEVAGVEFIQPLPKNLDKSRGGPTRTQSAIMSGTSGNNIAPMPVGAGGGAGSSMEGTVLVTKVQVWLVPSKFKFGPKEKKLGPEEFPVMYHVWYANDNRLIRVEPTYYWHSEFGYTLAQFTPDMHQTVSLGLADLIYRLQDVITWLINARVTDVRRNLRGRHIVNPTIIDTKSMDGEGDIFLRKGANPAMMERAIKPLDVNDVTRGHFADADVLGKIMQVVTGVNDNAMGQYNSGRRSASEARVVTAGAAGRMKMHGQLIWETSLGRLGRLMLSNLRQSLSLESFAMVIGEDPMLEQRYTLWKGTPQDVIAGADYFTFDSTLQSEKSFIAQSLQELLVAIMGNPTAAQQLDIDPRAMLEDIQYLRGTGNIGRYSLSKRVASGAARPLPPALVPEGVPQAAA
jgi:hypothetical protein